MNNYAHYVKENKTPSGFNTTRDFLIIKELTRKIYLEYNAIIENIKTHLNKHYRTPVGIPKQQMVGLQESDINTDIGIAIKIVNNSFLDINCIHL